MSTVFTINIVEPPDCEGHHLDVLQERSRERIRTLIQTFYYCDSCAVQMRQSIKRAMRERVINRDEDEGVPI